MFLAIIIKIDAKCFDGFTMNLYWHNYVNWFIYPNSFDTDDDSDYAMIKRIKMEPEAILSQEDDIMAQLQQESSDLEVEPSFTLEGSANGEDCNEGVLMQHMDIREPLSTLRNLLEQRLGVELTDYSFWLQDAQMVIIATNR